MFCYWNFSSGYYDDSRVFFSSMSWWKAWIRIRNSLCHSQPKNDYNTTHFKEKWQLPNFYTFNFCFSHRSAPLVVMKGTQSGVVTNLQCWKIKNIQESLLVLAWNPFGRLAYPLSSHLGGADKNLLFILFLYFHDVQISLLNIFRSFNEYPNVKLLPPMVATSNGDLTLPKPAAEGINKLSFLL